MATQIIGTQLNSGTGNWQNVPYSSYQQRAFIRFKATDAGFVRRMGFFARKSLTNNARVRLAIWEARSSDGLPGKLLGYTNELVVDTADQYEANLAWSSEDAALGATGAAIRIVPGQTYYLGLHNKQSQAGAVEVAIATSAVVRQVDFRHNIGALPTDPFNTDGQLAEKPGAIYGIMTVATGPVVTITGPPASISSSTPNLTATVTDAESGSPNFDRTFSYQVQVRVAATSVMQWAPAAFVASNAERNNGTIVRPYTGPALSATTYEWRVQATDDAGQPGDWTGWSSFTISNLGGVDTVTAPLPTNGFKEEDGVVANWRGTWSHPLGTAANGVHVKILSGNTTIRGGDDAPFFTLSPTVASGAAITVSDVDLQLTRGSNDPLPAGEYRWQMQGRAVGGAISPWSTPVVLTVNSPPNMPTGITPESGSVVPFSPLPTLEWFVSDNDADDILGADLVSQLRIIRLSNLSTVMVTTANVLLNPRRGWFTLTNTQIPAAGDYTIEVRGLDLSAGTAGEGPWSAPVLLTFASVPSVTITAPTQNQPVATSQPQITWTLSTGLQALYRVEFFRPNETTPFYSTGNRSGALGAYSVPAGVLTNGLFYDVTVTVWTTTDIQGQSTRRRFQVLYPQPGDVNDVRSSTYITDWDYEASSVSITWAETALSSSVFAGYVVTRRSVGQDPADATVVAHITQAARNEFIDYHAPPNRQLIYTVTQLRRATNGDIQESIPIETLITVPLGTPVIASLIEPADIRAPVFMLGDDFAEGFGRDEATIPTWGTGGLPTLVRSPQGYGQVFLSVGFRILEDERGTLHQHMARWRDVVRSGHPMSVRTETERFFMRVVPQDGWLQRTDTVGVSAVQLQLEEIAWTEAVRVRT